MRVKHKHELFFTDNEIVDRGATISPRGQAPPGWRRRCSGIILPASMPNQFTDPSHYGCITSSDSLPQSVKPLYCLLSA